MGSLPWTQSYYGQIWRQLRKYERAEGEAKLGEQLSEMSAHGQSRSSIKKKS